MTARTCRVKGTGESGMVICAAAAVTAAINATRVMVDAFNARLSDDRADDAPFTTVGPEFPVHSLRTRAFGPLCLRVT